MGAHRCCGASTGGSAPALATDVPPSRSVRRAIGGWILPGTLLVILPKCPACLAAYIALGTGVGLSLSTAAYLRWALLILCLSSLSYFATTWVAAVIRRRGHSRSYDRSELAGIAARCRKLVRVTHAHP